MRKGKPRVFVLNHVDGLHTASEYGCDFTNQLMVRVVTSPTNNSAVVDRILDIMDVDNKLTIHYKELEELPEDVYAKLCMLRMVDPDSKVEGIGWRAGEYVFWIVTGKDDVKEEKK